MATDEGLLLCPEGGATYAAFRAALADGRIGSNDRCVLFNCATGLKYPMPEAGERLDLNNVDYSKIQ
jgi:threonine synthase